MIMDSSEYLIEDMARQGSNGVKLELNDRYSFSERMVRKHKCSSPLNFATSVEDYEMHGPPTKKPKTPRDPMSHRIIEKRRRDRMNNCLADLSRLIPANYMKQGQGRIEKTEIIEMAIRHIKHLQNIHRSLVNQGQCCAEKFYLGFKECEAETIRYFVECEGLDNKDQFFMRVISHLEAVSKKHLATGTQNCTDFPKEEPSSGDKANISCSSLNAECDNKMKSNDRTLQTVPEILAPSHDSINSAASKQLRSLLSQGNAGFEQPDSGNASCADSLGMFSSSESSISGNNADEVNMNMNNGEGDMHYHGNVGSENGSSSGSSKENKFTNYKFKHDITKRFSEEEKYSVDISASLTQENIIEYQENHNYDKLGYEKHSKDKHGYDKHGHDKHDKHGHDKHSHDKHSHDKHDKHGHDKHGHDKHSHEKHGYDKHEKHGYDKHGFEKHEKLSSKLKRKIVRSMSPSSCSDSTAYPTSEHSSNGASNNVSTMLCHSPEDETVNNGVHLPAFVLHPQGTHYLPLTIQQSCFQNSLQQVERTQQPIVFHPISILVNFATPGLVIQNAESFVNNAALDVTFSSSSSSSTSASAAAAANAAADATADATTSAGAPLAENGNSNNARSITLVNSNNNNNNNNCPSPVINKPSLSHNCTTITSPYNLSPANSCHSVGSNNSSTSSSGSSSSSVTAVNNNNNNNNNSTVNTTATIPLNAIQANNHMSPVKHGNNTDHMNSGPVVVNSATSLPQTSSPPAATPTVTTATALLQTPTGALITQSILHQQQQQQQQQPPLQPQHLPIHQTHLPHIHPHQPPPPQVLPPQSLQPHPHHHLPSPNANSPPMIHMERDNRNVSEGSIPIVIPTSSCYQSL